MLFLSHRGFWRDASEKNEPVAFERSFAAGFGTELDVRDHDGELVVTHDLPVGADLMHFEELLALHRDMDRALPLAINIKADGLQSRLAELVTRFELQNYFVFDMSVPDTLGYLGQGLRCFTRHSEWEPRPALYEQTAGVWMDQFEGDWVSVDAVREHTDAGKSVCIVSSELHGRDPKEAWSRYAEGGMAALGAGVMLCTDHPDVAKEVFGG
jgi:hypothetical protein